MTYNTLQIKPKKLKMAILAVTNPIFRMNYYLKCVLVYLVSNFLKIGDTDYKTKL